ncbi:hypothetical protein [Kibdelosporangium aridum]|uniref:hypothetical protein n=1 Tax=Kibdelosporangium aridum TaxID=2030 RepID=UPI0005277348
MNSAVDHVLGGKAMSMCVIELATTAVWKLSFRRTVARWHHGTLDLGDAEVRQIAEVRFCGARQKKWK